jgi:hypothetical protein
VKHTFISASIVAMLSSGAIAGNIDTATADPVITSPTSYVTDWSGGYFGFSYSSVDGTHKYADSSSMWSDPHDFLDQSALGFHVGHNWQSNTLVYGVQLNIIQGLDGVTGHADDKLENVIEPCFRVGFTPENSNMLYVAHVGYANADYYDGNAKTTTDVSGVSFGVGGEMMLNNNISVGIDVTRRDLNNSTKSNAINTVSLLVNYHVD